MRYGAVWGEGVAVGDSRNISLVSRSITGCELIARGARVTRGGDLPRAWGDRLGFGQLIDSTLCEGNGQKPNRC